MEKSSIWNFKLHLLLLILAHSVSCGVISDPLSVSLIPDDELIDPKATCEAYDNCKLDRRMDLLFPFYSCNCDRSCAVFDTCCIDSVFRKSEPSSRRRHDLKCVQVYGDSSHVYMVDSCQPNYPKDLVADLCRGDGESTNDPMLLIPATSVSTGVTYKNRFCSICNNDTDGTTLWHLKVTDTTSVVSNMTSIPSFQYSNVLKTWETVSAEQNENAVPVSISVLAPHHIFTMVRNCELNLVSNCSREWTDVDVQQKCAAYMARVFIPRNGTNIPYRNPHCAICNFESLDKIYCIPSVNNDIEDVLFVSLFSLDEKNQKCGKDEVFDTLGKKCRALKCPPNHSVEKLKCVANS